MNSKDFSVVVMHFLELQRRDKKWSQEILSFKTSFSRSDISHLESGRKELKIYELIVLCQALEIKKEDVLNKALNYIEQNLK